MSIMSLDSCTREVRNIEIERKNEFDNVALGVVWHGLVPLAHVWVTLEHTSQ